jgi:hypothetical protein
MALPWTSPARRDRLAAGGCATFVRPRACSYHPHHISPSTPHGTFSSLKRCVPDVSNASCHFPYPAHCPAGVTVREEPRRGPISVRQRVRYSSAHSRQAGSGNRPGELHAGKHIPRERRVLTPSIAGVPITRSEEGRLGRRKARRGPRRRVPWTWQSCNGLIQEQSSHLRRPASHVSARVSCIRTWATHGHWGTAPRQGLHGLRKNLPPPLSVGGSAPQRVSPRAPGCGNHR